MKEILKLNLITQAIKDGNIYYDLKIQPYPSNNNVKIPKVGSDIFIMKTDNDSGFVVKCDEYDTTPIKVDNYLKMDLKKYLASFKADSFTLNTGKDIPTKDKRDINIYFNKLECNQITSIDIQTNSTNILMKDNDLLIKGDKVGIGIVGENEYSFSEFDDDYKKINDEYNLLSDFIDDLLAIYYSKTVATNFNNIKVATFNNSSIFINEVIIPFKQDTIDTSIYDKYLYSDFNVDSSKLFNEIVKQRNNLRNKKEFVYTDLLNEFGTDIVAFILQSLMISIGNRYDKTALTGDRTKNEGVYIYEKILNNPKYTLISNNIKPYLLKSVNPIQDVKRIINTEIPIFMGSINTYVSPEDASQIVFNYILCRFTLLSIYKKNISDKYNNEKINKTKVPFSDSLGLILKDFLDEFSSKTIAYKVNPNAPPPYLFVSGNPEITLKANVKSIKEDIDEFLY